MNFEPGNTERRIFMDIRLYQASFKIQKVMLKQTKKKKKIMDTPPADVFVRYERLK